ncbi:MAG: DUF87 domain-containing protein [Gammaproteobacteria bacterium]|nr:DUF87 domain-containing protein [Gammaproteobacteria bacterium]
MTSLVEEVGQRVVGTVEEVLADRISVLLDPDSPQATALNAGTPTGFPRINGYVVIPNESGGTVCIVSSVRTVRLPFPKRLGMQRDFGLVDLPFPSRSMSLTPIGTLTAGRDDAGSSFQVHRGVDVFPSVGDSVLLPTVDQLRAIVQGEDETAKRILIGHCPTASYAPVHVDPDRLFGRHLAVLGNTGAGKSCTVAGLLRWSLEAATATAPSGCPPNARFIVLDPNGEYAKAFEDQDVRVFQVGEGAVRPLRVPAWLWTGAEWAAFTDAAPGVQRPLLFEALRRLRSGLGPPEAFDTIIKGRISRYRNRLKVLVANADHQSPGRREGAAGVLINIQEDFLSLAEAAECTDDDLREALRSVSATAGTLEQNARSNPKKPPDSGFWHNDFAEHALDNLVNALEQAASHTDLDEGDLGEADENSPIPFPVAELPDYVEALAADQTGRDIGQFVDTLKLRIRGILRGGRLGSVIDAETSSSTLVGWLNDYIGDDDAKNGPIAILDLSLVPSEVIHVTVSVLARMVFEALQRYRRMNGCELPTTLVLV